MCKDGKVTKEKTKKTIRAPFKILLVLIVFLFGADLWLKYTRTGTLSGKGFSEKQVSELQESIKRKIEESDDVKVSEVFLIKVSPMNLEGYVNLTLPSGEKYQNQCTAKKGENLKVMWRCTSKE